MSTAADHFPPLPQWTNIASLVLVLASSLLASGIMFWRIRHTWGKGGQKGAMAASWALVALFFLSIQILPWPLEIFRVISRLVITTLAVNTVLYYLSDLQVAYHGWRGKRQAASREQAP